MQLADRQTDRQIIPLPTEYEAHPQSKFAWGRAQKQNTIAWKYIATDTASVQLFFNIFATRIETFVIPWDQLLYTVS
jgi:hypothetical protein